MPVRDRFLGWIYLLHLILFVELASKSLALSERVKDLEQDLRDINNHTRFCITEDFFKGESPPVGYRHSYLHLENQWPPTSLEGREVLEAEVLVLRRGEHRVAIIPKLFHPDHPETPSGFAVRAVR